MDGDRGLDVDVFDPENGLEENVEVVRALTYSFFQQSLWHTNKTNATSQNKQTIQGTVFDEFIRLFSGKATTMT